jgi:serine protease AprX
MRKYLPLFVAILFIYSTSQAQFTRYIVQLKNKGGSPYSLSNPSGYLSQRAIDRRTRYNIAIDSTDLPVTPSYITQIAAIPNVTILNVSKWLNSVTILTSDANAITSINALSFVQSTSGIAARQLPNGDRYNAKFQNEETVTPLINSTSRVERIESDYYNYGTGSYNEIHLHNGEFLHDIGLRGQGMQIAMLDGGFYHYTTLSAFDSVNAENRVLDTWDFVNREASVVEDDAHGMECMSTIAANIPGQFVGKAPKASFYLYKTEDIPTEYPIEEHNWVCGAERADSAGVDIISTSLGYTTFDNPSFDHTYNDMNGNTTMAAIGADLAAKKGLLVFAAVGNDGSNTWHYLSTPSDGDSVMAVGAVNTSGAVGGFSSYGPSSDGQVKPDMASIGVNAIVEATNNTVGTSNGTSFATPNMAGLATCLWQAFPEYNNMKIATALHQAGSIYSTPDDRIGYGIPDMKLAFTNLLTEFATSSASNSTCSATINWTSKDVSTMKYEIERKAPGESSYTKVGEVSGQGNSLANHNYQFDNTLTNVQAGTIYYRIRQIVDTNTVSFTAVYIDTCTTSISAACTATGVGDPSGILTKIIVYPNPSKEQASLGITTGNAIQQLIINVYDNKGSLIYKLKKSKTSGTSVIDLPASHLPSGKYLIIVYDDQQVIGNTEWMKL